MVAIPAHGYNYTGSNFSIANANGIIGSYAQVFKLIPFFYIIMVHPIVGSYSAGWQKNTQCCSVV